MNLYRILGGASAGIMLLGLVAPYFGLGPAHYTYDLSLSFAVLMVVIALCCGLCTGVYRFVKALSR
jgi:hypothetical protein